jgi:hypothetical protein
MVLNQASSSRREFGRLIPARQTAAPSPQCGLSHIAIAMVVYFLLDWL